MTGQEFRKQITRLGWSQSHAARELGVPAGKSRIGEWMRGSRTVPPYIAAHIYTLMAHSKCQGEGERGNRPCTCAGAMTDVSPQLHFAGITHK